jgi:putative copper export protein
MGLHWLLLVIHILSACVWVGGHLLLATRFLPKALKLRDPGIIRAFERSYERIGIPSLLLLAASGIALSMQYGITYTDWFTFTNSITRIVSLKLILFIVTVLFALHARLFILPRLSSANLRSLSVHIVLITVLAVIMVLLGTTIRWGGI